MKKIFLYASAAALVLSGCTKEMAENVAPSISGEDMIVASLASDAGTRTHLQENGAYGWDDTADALGVFAAEAGNKVNAYFGYAGKDDNNKTIFQGNLKSVKGGSFIAYYPYSAGKAISAQGKLAFEIPATQYYNHNYTGGYGSFDAGVVPMVAMNETPIALEDKGNTLQLEFNPLASYIAVPFRGDGTINTISLVRKTSANGSFTKIAGNVTVDLFTEDKSQVVNYKTEKNTDEETGAETTERVPVLDETFFTVTKDLQATRIILDCGDGVKLNPTTKKYFVFVVPPYIEIAEGNELVFKVNDTEEYAYTFTAKNTTGRNKLLPLTSVDFVYDGAGRYRIENENQFVEYAYAATYGQLAKHEMNDGTGLKNAIILGSLHFEGYKYDGSYKEVEKWYNDTNKGAITTIGGSTAPALQFSIEGEGDITISGLKVKGDGLFAGNSQGSAVKNISFSGLKVEDDKNGGVLTDNLYSEAVATTYEDVVLNDVQEGKAVVGRVQTYALEKADAITYPEGTVFANTLVAASNWSSYAFGSEVAAVAEVEEEASDVYKPAFTVPARYANFNTLEVPSNNNGVIFYVDYDSSSSSIYAKELMAKVILIDKNGWYSVLDNVNHKSYWTGTSAADNKDGIYTAEELVYDLAQSTTTEIILDTDIDFGINKAKLENVVKTTSLEVDGGSKTITRANIYGDGLFGKNATVTNLTVSSSFVYGTAVLAETGTAPEGVTLTNINYKFATEKILGGMFYEGSFEQAKQTKGKVSPTNIEGKEFGAHYAKMIVTLGVEDNTLLPANAPYAVIVCKGENLGADAKNTNIYFEKGADLEAIANKIEWAGVIPTDYQVELISGDSRKNLTYDGKVYDEDMLKKAMDDALLSEATEVTITVAPGTYSAFTYGSNKTYNNTDKKITIDCNGAEFKGDNQMRFGENTTIKNARINNTANNAHFVSGNFVDCIFEGEDGHGFSNVYASSGTTLTFTNCTFYAANYATYLKSDGTFDTSRALHIAENKDVTVIVNDCHFYGYCPISNEPKITFDGCDFHPTDKGTGDFAGVGLRGHALVKNCTFELAAELCDHNEFAFKAATNSSGEAYKYEIYGCTVNGDAFSPLADYVTIEKEQTTIYYSGNAEGTGAVGVVPPVTGEKPAKK